MGVKPTVVVEPSPTTMLEGSASCRRSTGSPLSRLPLSLLSTHTRQPPPKALLLVALVALSMTGTPRRAASLRASANDATSSVCVA